LLAGEGGPSEGVDDFSSLYKGNQLYAKCCVCKEQLQRSTSFKGFADRREVKNMVRRLAASLGL
jgi:hypothetical protein